MFAGLDEVDWYSLQHAYGPAGDVPRMLRLLASKYRIRRKKAIYELYGTIWHQGTIYSATPHAVPFLIELLARPDQKDRDEIVVYLAHLATAGPHLPAAASVLAKFGKDERDTPEFKEKVAQEQNHIQRTHEAVGEGLDLYLRLLGDDERTVRYAVPYLLSVLPEKADCSVPAIRAALQIEQDADMRASLVRSLACLLGPDAAGELEAALDDADGLVQFAAAMGLVSCRQPSPQVADILLRAFLEPKLADRWARLPWSWAGEEGDAAAYLGGLGPEAAPSVVPQLIEVLSRQSGIAAISVSGAMLQLAFGGPVEKGVRFDQLTELQQSVVKALAYSHTAWIASGNMSDLLLRFGLPDWWHKLQDYAGLPPRDVKVSPEPSWWQRMVRRFPLRHAQAFLLLGLGCLIGLGLGYWAPHRPLTLATVLRVRGITPEKITAFRFVGDESSITTGRSAIESDVSWVWDGMIETAEPYSYWLPSGYRRVEILVRGQQQPAAVLFVNETDATHLEGDSRQFMCHGLHDLAMHLLVPAGPPATTPAIDLSQIEHMGPKGRVQDKEYNPDLPIVDALIAAGPAAIPFLVQKLADETRFEAQVIDYWPGLRVGDLALVILCDFFKTAGGGHSTIPGLSWDAILERRLFSRHTDAGSSFGHGVALVELFQVIGEEMPARGELGHGVAGAVSKPV